MICILWKNIDYANLVIKTLSIMMISDMPLGYKKFFRLCCCFSRALHCLFSRLKNPFSNFQLDTSFSNFMRKFKYQSKKSAKYILPFFPCFADFQITALWFSYRSFVSFSKIEYCVENTAFSGDFWLKWAIFGALDFKFTKSVTFEVQNRNVKKPARNDSWDKSLQIWSTV